MKILKDLQPAKVFSYFEEITEIPHGSGNVKQISDYIVEFAKTHHLKYRQDEAYNVLVWKDGTKGYENSEPVILQGHIDMVAVKTADCEKDMQKDGLDLEINGDWIQAKKTTLGGDDGIAVAYALAVLDSNDMMHPPIEAIFTVDEEIGMLGAAAIDVSNVRGRLLLNIDSEDEGVFTVSCAGGATVECSIPYKTEMIHAQVLEIRIDGFIGGHSGVEINKGRANANCVMGRILLNLFQNVGMRIMAVNGGEKDNAIANASEAAIAVLPEVMEKAKDIVNNTFLEVKEEYKITDSNAKLTMNVIEEGLIEPLSGPATLATVILLANMPNGVQRMNPEMPEMVQTSLNLGIVRTQMDAVKLSYSVRSSSESEKNYLIEKLRSLTEIFGGEIKCEGVYPGWEYNANSRLRNTCIEAYKELYDGKEPIVEGIHAGLECGLFASKLEGLDAISFGPDMRHVHTTDERLSISSTQRTWKLLVKILEMLK
ncbi:aminoacyl-histidine dipeptidase [uncultured Eubacterium sp.]|uniref:aminoacyl-histidine dipeptidase n=1 Tax=uncultured Eubacterium sp. TaxID=165185 RepID=UPI002670D5FB|nr:aminoacyl-histidine dipeptidase [uncultured Eubacterium sp.]